MGRYAYSDRNTVEESKKISITRLKKWGYLNDYERSGTLTYSRGGMQSGSIGIILDDDNTYLTLDYTQTNRYTGKTKHYHYKVNLTVTRCHFGGLRYWFVCPIVKNGKACNRRVGTLYLPPGGGYFGCRHCHDLTYDDQKTHNKCFDHFKAFKISCKIDRLFSTGNKKDRKRAMKLLEKIKNTNFDELLRQEEALLSGKL